MKQKDRTEMNRERKHCKLPIVPFLCQRVWNVKQLQIERLLGNGFGLHH